MVPQEDVSTIGRRCSKPMNFCDVPGARLHYQEVVSPGSAVDRMLLCINGYQRPGSDFLSFAKKITQALPGTCCIFFDNRGVGLTTEDLPGPLSVEGFAQDAHDLAVHRARHYGLEAYAALGISMGGMIAQALPTVAKGAGGPQPVALVLVSTTPGGALRVFTPHDDQGANRPFTPFPQELEAMKRILSKYFGEPFLTSNPLAVEAMAKSIIASQRTTGESSLLDSNQGGAPRQYRAAMAFDGNPYHGACRNIPTLVTSGSLDRIIPVENSYVLARAITAHEVRIYPGAGHLLLMEKPKEFYMDVANFLDRLSIFSPPAR